ncbi:MAG: hypothetical protein H0V54_06655 [Chthoniobacterales bacterium]|nr:hypothetical protein [Chthoniobacterales bacterium]
MVHISIRDLHMKTGEWVRKAAAAGGIIVMDRSQPVVKLVPFTKGDHGKLFAERPLTKGFSALPKMRHDSTRFVSEERDRT